MNETITAVFIALTAWSLGPCVLTIALILLVVGAVYAWAYVSAWLEGRRHRQREHWRKMGEE